MRWLKQIFRTILIAIASLVGFVLLYLLVAFVLSSISVAEEPGTPDEVTMYILTNGVHTDLVVPVVNEQYDWRQLVPHQNTQAKDSSMPWLALGWGDKGFYLQTPAWKDLKASVAFNAAFGLSTTAIHATFYPQMKPGEDCREIRVSRAQYGRLVQYITQSFQRSHDGRSLHIPTTAVYGRHDAFYEAHGSYSMLHTCNTWANSGLKAAGQKACWWTAFDSGIFNQYK
ncbi:MAG: TIGR02117 family protein [Chitinophagaceae bacterium]|nr:TIGR02117 family protein [Chitinophagaceae bacterium]